jgi:hypothetical protein
MLVVIAGIVPCRRARRGRATAYCCDQRSTKPRAGGARPRRVRYRIGLILAPAVLLAAAACAAPTATPAGTVPAPAATACGGDILGGAPQPSSATPMSPPTGAVASAVRSVAALPASPALATSTDPLSSTCPPETSGAAGSPMPAMTPVSTSPTPPPTTPGGNPSPTPTSPNAEPTATFSAGHTLTFADNGAAVAVTVGQHLDLLLPPDSGLGAWDRPIIDGASLTITSASGGYPSDTPLRVTFTALAAGDATIRTGTDLACFHTTPKCLPPVMGWSVTVHITGGG